MGIIISKTQMFFFHFTEINLRILVLYGHTKSKLTLAKNFSNFIKPTSSVRLKGKFFYLSIYLRVKRKREKLFFCFVFLNFNLT